MNVCLHAVCVCVYMIYAVATVIIVVVRASVRPFLWLGYRWLDAKARRFLCVSVVVVRASVRPLRKVSRSSRQRWSISGYRKVEARARRFLCVAVATGTNTSGVCKKNQATKGTHIQWPADSQGALFVRRLLSQ